MQPVRPVLIRRTYYKIGKCHVVYVICNRFNGCFATVRPYRPLWGKRSSISIHALVRSMINEA